MTSLDCEIIQQRQGTLQNDAAQRHMAAEAKKAQSKKSVNVVRLLSQILVNLI